MAYIANILKYDIMTLYNNKYVIISNFLNYLLTRWFDGFIKTT